MLLKFVAYDLFPRSVTLILPDNQLQLWNHFHTSFNDTSKVGKNSLNLCLPIYPMLSLSLPCQATTLWGHKMGLREWGGNCGWRESYGIWQKRGDLMDWKRGGEEGDSRELWLLRLVSFRCRHYAHLRRPWEGENKKVDFAIFFLLPITTRPSSPHS